MSKISRMLSKVSSSLRQNNTIPVFVCNRYADMIVNIGQYKRIECSEGEEKQLRVLVKHCTIPFQVFYINDKESQKIKDSNDGRGTLATIHHVVSYDDGSLVYGIHLEKRISGLSKEDNSNGISYATFEEYDDITKENENKLMKLISEINHFLDIYLPIRLPNEDFIKYATRCSLSFLNLLRVNDLLESTITEELCYSQNLLSRLEFILKQYQNNPSKFNK